MRALNKFNDWLAVQITSAVATMWCAYLFAAIAIYGGMSVNWHKPSEAVQWLSQTFLQLVLLSIIMVGQKVLSESSDKQAKEMYDTVMASHKELQHLVRELHAAISATRHEAQSRFETLHPGQGKTSDAAADQSQL